MVTGGLLIPPVGDLIPNCTWAAPIGPKLKKTRGSGEMLWGEERDRNRHYQNTL